MYQIAICDDQPEDSQRLLALTRQILQNKRIDGNISLFSTPAALLHDLDERHSSYDLYFLDIFLGKESGLDLARALRERGDQGKLIFVTVSPDYALECFDLGTDNYLVKPITEEALSRALTRLLKRRDLVAFSSFGGSLLPLSADTILWAEAFSHTTQLHTASKTILVRGTLEETKRKLEAYGFARCHRSYLVNLDHVEEIGKRELQLSDGTWIPIGRSGARSFREAFFQHTQVQAAFDVF